MLGTTIIYEMGEGNDKQEIEALISGYDREVGLTVQSIETGERCICLNRDIQLETEPIEQYYHEFDGVTECLKTGRITSMDRLRIFSLDSKDGVGGLTVSIACAFE